MYVYIQSEKELWTVGFYRPDGEFEPESDHESPVVAAKKVAYLNGETTMPNMKEIISQTLEEITKELNKPASGTLNAILKLKGKTTMKLNKDRNYNFEVIRDFFETSQFHVIISEKGSFIDQKVLTVKADDPFQAVETAIKELKRKSKKV